MNNRLEYLLHLFRKMNVWKVTVKTKLLKNDRFTTRSEKSKIDPHNSIVINAIVTLARLLTKRGNLRWFPADPFPRAKLEGV